MVVGRLLRLRLGWVSMSCVESVQGRAGQQVSLSSRSPRAAVICDRVGASGLRFLWRIFTYGVTDCHDALLGDGVGRGQLR